MSTKDTEDAGFTTARIEALVLTARRNAYRFGGDHATAAADLMCAFVLISRQAGADPEQAAAIMLPHALAACDDFFPDRRGMQ